MKRAFLFGLTVQLIIVGVIFLLLGEQMIPMARSPVIGIVALCLAAASGFFAWKAALHPSWPVKIGMWIAGFLAVYVAIPVIEIVAVMAIAVFSN
ncbi:MAG: hypothetical protein F9K19_18285 [Rhizobiaceae bacterium]|nr:MAG: hypothetical protein F9K19_18285 [Rhizobiaceae bacterium]CAG0999943.1 hypothetical protein RHIZO_02762 [Rhizobiaceae bacterium]